MRANSTYLALGAIVAGIGAWAAIDAAPSEQLDAPAISAGCARQFERAQRVDMESFRDYDAETFRAGHHPETTTVFASGAVRYGIDAVMEALRSHYRGKWLAVADTGTLLP